MIRLTKTHISKSVLAVGGAVLAAGLIGFTNPKTVHALAAALVQVTNTASNPVVTQAVHEQAGQIVHLHCGPGTPSDAPGTQSCVLVDGTMPVDGINPPQETYVVPANQSLVITSVTISPTQASVSMGCSVPHGDRLWVELNGGTGYTAQNWEATNLAAQFNYSSGIVVAAGLRMNVDTDYYPYAGPCWSDSNSIDTTDVMDLYGYLTPA